MVVLSIVQSHRDGSPHFDVLKVLMYFNVPLSSIVDGLTLKVIRVISAVS